MSQALTDAQRPRPASSFPPLSLNLRSCFSLSRLLENDSASWSTKPPSGPPRPTERTSWGQSSLNIYPMRGVKGCGLLRAKMLLPGPVLAQKSSQPVDVDRPRLIAAPHPPSLHLGATGTRRLRMHTPHVVHKSLQMPEVAPATF